MCVPLCMHNTSCHGGVYLIRKTYGLGMCVYTHATLAKMHAGTRSLSQTTIQQINSVLLFWMVRNALHAHFNIRNLTICMGKVSRLKTWEHPTGVLKNTWGLWDSPFSWKALFIPENGEPAVCVIDGQYAVYLHSNSSFKIYITVSRYGTLHEYWM